MKTLLYTFALLIAGTAFAQDSDNPVDHMETTKVKTEGVKTNGKLKQTKVKVVTKKEQQVMTDPSQSHLRDADQVIAPTKTTKTVSIDNNSDNRYETTNTISYYTYDDVKYSFKSGKNGFVMTTNDGTKDVVYGTARKSSNGQFYLFDSKGYNGVGYFDNNENFVIEYYDTKLNKVVNKSFKSKNL
ncbi:hypothetical protein [Lacinutrix sp. MedPE-SW]|uniref:hypothetical protein n=1 Tax=Lacinutrix sp. MedPE-SW TaxID=1860087 RepID=UPI00091D60A5|nr:hypothetical protein [Lacinutrix sp. MedPE-SW]OIQ21213.1 MAG: hypothetical protein BM549_09565 [Lacinutrix sp. MedPE-SW]